MFIVKNRRYFFVLSGFLIGFSILSIFVWGFNFGIEFTGGTILEVSYPAGAPSISEVESLLEPFSFTDSRVQVAGEDGYIIRTPPLNDEDRGALLSALNFGGTHEFIQERFNFVGPIIGEELRQKAWIAIGTVVVAIILFVAFAFRQVSKPVTSWKYGVVAIVALMHDIIIPTGIFAFLGSIFVNAQIDVLFVTALLAILGYSVNDTIIVFDRVRENIKLRGTKHFEDTVGISLSQTYTRSINTSITTLFVLTTLFLIGGEATKNFTLVLAIGVVAGTYSSIFIATPLLVELHKWSEKK